MLAAVNLNKDNNFIAFGWVFATEDYDLDDRIKYLKERGLKGIDSYKNQMIIRNYIISSVFLLLGVIGVIVVYKATKRNQI